MDYSFANEVLDTRDFYESIAMVQTPTLSLVLLAEASADLYLCVMSGNLCVFLSHCGTNQHGRGEHLGGVWTCFQAAMHGDRFTATLKEETKPVRVTCEDDCHNQTIVFDEYLVATIIDNRVLYYLWYHNIIANNYV